MRSLSRGFRSFSLGVIVACFSKHPAVMETAIRPLLESFFSRNMPYCMVPLTSSHHPAEFTVVYMDPRQPSPLMHARGPCTQAPICARVQRNDWVTTTVDLDRTILRAYRASVGAPCIPQFHRKQELHLICFYTYTGVDSVRLSS